MDGPGKPFPQQDKLRNCNAPFCITRFFVERQARPSRMAAARTKTRNQTQFNSETEVAQAGSQLEPNDMIRDRATS